MATIPIYRQDYALSGETPSQQFAGIEPNVFSPSLSGVTLASQSNTIAPSVSTDTDDFKDHKTLFIFTNAGAATTVTFKGGDTYAGRDVTASLPSGTCAIWLDSSKFADKTDGTIKIDCSGASVTAYGVEMR